MAKLCVHPSCKQVVRDGTARCDKHKKDKKRENNERRKQYGRRNSKIYDSARWRRLSDKKRQVCPFCEMCYDKGVTVVADVVDHIEEIEDGGAPFSWDNLMSLCHGCHNRKTAEDKRKRKGKP